MLLELWAIQVNGLSGIWVNHGVIMLEKLAIFAPIALLLPVADGGTPAPAFQPDNGYGAEAAPLRDQFPTGEGQYSLEAIYPVPVQHQVRIEQRIVVRISPRSANARQNLLAEVPRQVPVQELEERKIGKCLPVKSIAAVQTGSGNQLLLYTRDRRIISARLEKACRARDFYSGFYVEQNKDGMLCVERDKLQSRAGANCEINRIRQLVVDDD